MNILKRFLKGFGFRTAFPTFEPGEEISAYMTGYSAEKECGIVRIGDTIIEVPDASRRDIDHLLRISITSFNDREHRGEGELISTPDSNEDTR